VSGEVEGGEAPAAAAAGTVAEALAPIHRSYLRRLDEMAARVAPGALLREATTRDGAGQLMAGADGLPLRFDVADSETGSTFEVRSARYDPPAHEKVRVGALEVELLPGCWEVMALTCRFPAIPSADDGQALARLLRAFAELGQFGAFCAPGAAAPWQGRIHGVQLTSEADAVIAIFDLGSAPPEAVEVLLRALDGFGRDRTPLAKVVLGGPVPDGPVRPVVFSRPPAPK
jgi:hypothetical protein